MAKSARENRVPIMFSSGELTAIDDWRFGNRIATRADAVRRLCQIGFAGTVSVQELDSIARSIDIDLIEYEALVDRMRSMKGKADALEILKDMAEVSSRIISLTARLVTMLSGINETVIASSRNETIEDVVARVENITRRMQYVKDPRQADWLEPNQS